MRNITFFFLTPVVCFIAGVSPPVTAGAMMVFGIQGLFSSDSDSD